MKFKKSDEKFSFWFKVVLIAGGLLLIVNRGFWNYITLEIDERKLNQQIIQTRNDSAKLKQDIELLKNNTCYIEYRIRRDLKYIKPGEYEYRFVKDKKGD